MGVQCVFYPEPLLCQVRSRTAVGVDGPGPGKTVLWDAKASGGHGVVPSICVQVSNARRRLGFASLVCKRYQFRYSAEQSCNWRHSTGSLLSLLRTSLVHIPLPPRAIGHRCQRFVCIYIYAQSIYVNIHINTHTGICARICMPYLYVYTYSCKTAVCVCVHLNFFDCGWAFYLCILG